MFEIKLDKQPEKFLKSCEKLLFDRIAEKPETLKQNPTPHDASGVYKYSVKSSRSPRKIGRGTNFAWQNSEAVVANR